MARHPPSPLTNTASVWPARWGAISTSGRSSSSVSPTHALAVMAMKIRVSEQPIARTRHLLERQTREERVSGDAWRRSGIRKRDEREHDAARPDRFDPADGHECDHEGGGFDDQSQRFLEDVAIG